jgi:hypothetical protein
LPISNAATRSMSSSVSWVSSSTRPPLHADPTTARLPAGATRDRRNLIRVLKATVTGPRRGSQRPAVSRPQRSQACGVSGQPAQFSPKAGVPAGNTGAV